MGLDLGGFVKRSPIPIGVDLASGENSLDVDSNCVFCFLQLGTLAISTYCCNLRALRAPHEKLAGQNSLRGAGGPDFARRRAQTQNNRTPGDRPITRHSGLFRGRTVFR